MKKINNFFLLASFLAPWFYVNGQTPPRDPTNSLPPGAAVPEWPSLTPFVPQDGFASIRSKDVEVIHSPDPLGGFVVRVAGNDVAFGSQPAVFGYLHSGELHWLNCARAATQKRKVEVQ